MLNRRNCGDCLKIFFLISKEILFYKKFRLTINRTQLQSGIQN
uniref:Trcl Probable zinc-ribbon domain n=1 Tax=virus sp. ctEQ64 TaxID=2825809 RepID=A0A8S5RKH6_9VIRU|nr:MAG TPA: trcl Probable zinc-ribbon domain [virus sp. ctEQ64]